MSGFGSLCTTLSLFLFSFSSFHTIIVASLVHPSFFSLCALMPYAHRKLITTYADASPMTHVYIPGRGPRYPRTRTAFSCHTKVVTPYDHEPKKRRNVYYTPFSLASVRSLASHQAVGVSSSRLDARRDATDDIDIDIICSMADGQ